MHSCEKRNDERRRMKSYSRQRWTESCHPRHPFPQLIHFVPSSKGKGSSEIFDRNEKVEHISFAS